MKPKASQTSHSTGKQNQTLPPAFSSSSQREKKTNRVGLQAKTEKLTGGSMLYQGLLLSVRKDTWPIPSSKLVCEPLTKNSTFRQFPFQKNFKRNPRKLCRGHFYPGKISKGLRIFKCWIKMKIFNPVHWCHNLLKPYPGGELGLWPSASTFGNESFSPRFSNHWTSLLEN